MGHMARYPCWPGWVTWVGMLQQQNNYKKLLTFAKYCTIVYLSVLLVCAKICGYVWLQVVHQEQTFLYKCPLKCKKRGLER